MPATSPPPVTNPAQPAADVPMSPSTTDKAISAATYLANTATVTAAPLLNNLNPNINPTNAGGIAVSLIGDGITCIVQGLSALGWFQHEKWAIWACVILACAICGGLYIYALHNPEQGVLNALGAMYKASSNYGPLSRLGVYNRSTT